MATIESVKIYLGLLHNAEAFFELDPIEQDKAIFTATETLKDHFSEDKLTDRAIALQVLYMLEGEGEEFAMLKRQGVKSYNIKGVSITFDGSGISPDVVTLLESTTKASVGRLI